MTTRHWRALAAVLCLVGGLLTVVAPKAEAALPCTCTVFGNAVPATVDGGADSLVKLGMVFHTDTDGWVTGVRFYKSAANTGTHIGQLWSYTDISHEFLLSTVTFTGETASGWQTASFAVPIKLVVGEQYVISYNSPIGHYSYDSGYFGSLPVNVPLHVDSPGGVYSYISSDPINEFPQTATTTNYWVDVVFQTNRPENSLFNMTYATPATPVAPGSPPAATVGTTFTSDIPNKVIGIRMYSDPYFFKPDTVQLWTGTGSLLASTTDADYNGVPGWHELYFSSPVSISANTNYVASYFNVGGYNGGYGYTSGFFSSPYTFGQLHSPINAGVKTDGGSPTFPTTASNKNYWVEPVFAYEADEIQNVQVDPVFSFGVTNQATACNGEANFISGAGSSTGVSFGHPTIGTNVSGGQALTVSSNAGGGFGVYIRGTQSANNLRSGTHNFSDAAGTYAAPAPIGAGEAFGYTYKDSTAATSVTNPAAANFIALDSTNRAVMGSSTSMTGTGCVSFDAHLTAATPAGAYAGSAIYTAVPTF